jgi:Icc-related predicted phosphoesterase
MKIQFASDLHLEFKENLNYVLAHPLEKAADILVLAGDIIPFTLQRLADKFFDDISGKFEYVYWVPGNHEYYRSNLTSADVTVSKNIRNNLSLVNNQCLVWDDVQFVFTTLWGNISPMNEFTIQNSLNDFELIKIDNAPLQPSDFNAMHDQALKFLTMALHPLHPRNMEKKAPTVVVTHHVPTLMNYPPIYKGSALNEAFAVELYDLILERQPAAWIYGHHHFPAPSFQIGKTWMLNNQLGYVKRGENSEYNRKAVFETTDLLNQYNAF